MRVLVIDDEDSARCAVAQGLRAAGVEVLEAADGPAGLAKALDGGVDLIVLDLRLPGMDGEEVLAKLRRSSAVPVIVVSSKRHEDDRVGVLDLGADDYLVKPFTIRELEARIRAVLRRSDGEVTSATTIGELTVDFPSRTATRGGEPVALTAQEFALLACLARHRGRLVSRAMLEEAIHPGENVPEEMVSNVVDVLVLRLRRKLGRDLITTRRGQGFIIDGARG
ncbi:MAG: response regulator transcription factor [Planctomycetota bacterium]|nr:response regulator transcription factor [Planctomycetota bacterium]